MTTAPQILDELAQCGVTLRAEGARLRFHPVDRVTPEQVAELRAHKAELIDYLAERQTTIRCPWCRSVDLIDGWRGVWCQSCERLAWLPTGDGGAVRADLATDSDRAESERRWQQRMALRPEINPSPHAA